MQQLLPPVSDHVLRDVHGDHRARSVLADALDVVEHRGGDLAVGRREDLQRNGDVTVLPESGQLTGVGVVDVDGERLEDVGPRRAGEGQRAQRGQVHIGHQQNSMVAAGQHHVGTFLGVRCQLTRDRVVVPVDGPHQDEQRAHHDDGDPGTDQELGDQHHDEHGSGGDEADGVDHAGTDHPNPLRRVGLGAQQPGPVPDHADLTEREGREHAHDVQLDQRGDLRLEHHDERDRREGQEDDAVGEGEPVTAGVQLVRKVPVLRQDRTQHREAVESGVGRQDQDQRGDAGDQIQPGREVPEDRVGQLSHQGFLLVVRRRADQLL